MMSRIVLITGSGSGFGKGTALLLAERGHHVIATTETDTQAAALASEHPSLDVRVLDVTNGVDVAGVAEIDVDVLINNAAIGVLGPIANVPIDLVTRSFEVNVFGMVAMSQAVIPGMRRRGWGRIINVSSVAGVLASAQGSPYSMTKHAVEAFTKSLRAELAPHGIDVTKVNPGPYDTGFNDRMVNAIPTYIDEGDETAVKAHQFRSKVLLKRQLDPGEVAIALANLTEADETPLETFLPEGILETLQPDR